LPGDFENTAEAVLRIAGSFTKETADEVRNAAFFRTTRGWKDRASGNQGAERVRFKGDGFDIPDTPVRPKPLQKPHPPIWMAAIGDESFEIAGRRGFNLLCSLIYGFKSDRVAELIRAYRDALRDYGHDPFKGEIGALCMVYCAETTEQARQDFGDPVLWYYRTIANYVAPRQPNRRSRDTRTIPIYAMRRGQ
jgi:alkanesulfonate monooxygenase SsuD/methylene tetrahydromethanopterin reductase-like flavin-dependent oxidoreductase (luciferase family)